MADTFRGSMLFTDFSYEYFVINRSRISMYVVAYGAAEIEQAIVHVELLHFDLFSVSDLKRSWALPRIDETTTSTGSTAVDWWKALKFRIRPQYRVGVIRQREDEPGSELCRFNRKTLYIDEAPCLLRMEH